MPNYIRKSKEDILRESLDKLQKNTPITATAPGSVARALVEAMSVELGDFYSIMDFNLSQSLVTTATGSSLDFIGSLYNVPRKSINSLAALDAVSGSFYFYMLEPSVSSITIPDGTNVYSNMDYIGQRYSFSVVGDITILPGRTKAYATIQPNFIDDGFTAGANSLIIHDAVMQTGINILCTNPKAISSRPTYENDDSYRTRIVKSMRVSASGTAEAIRFAGLSVPGIRDVRVKQIGTGLGTFEAVIIPEIAQFNNTVINNCISAMDEVRPLGVRMNAITPNKIPVDISIQLITPAVSSASMKEATIGRAQLGIQRYMNSLMPGDSIVYNQIIQSVFNASELVKDVIIKKFAVNGVEVLRRNYQPESNQQLIPSSINVEVATS